VTADPSTTIGKGGDATRDERWYLTDEQDFLRRSLDDAGREHEAGDLSDEDYDVLVARDAARLSEVEAELAALGPEPAEQSDPHASWQTAPGTEATDADGDGDGAARPPMALWRKVGIGASCLLIVFGIVILVVHFVQARQPGQASSGGISVSQAQQIEQQLTQAASLASAGGAKNDQAALDLYNEVLSADPSNPAALSGAGWLMWNLGTASHVAGYIEDGRSEVTRAVRVAPTYYQAHLYLGLILANQDHNNAAAVVQFDAFLADNPPADELPVVAPDVDPSYLAVGKPVPAALAISSTTTTTSPSAP
jgi:tetratricopeptide (TPR) repeat protein